MHYALLIPDILERVFEYIKVDGVLNSYFTFFALARTCSALSEVSLDALWSDLESLYPLVSCIYRANMRLLNERTAGADNDALDLSVFYKHAYRVRKLSLSRLYGGDVTEDLGVFHALRVPYPLLPNLTHLVWSDGLGLSPIWHLLNPRLQSLRIPTSLWASGSTPLFLSRIQGLCPELRSLTLHVSVRARFEERAVADACLSRLIGSWQKLEELDCFPMSCDNIISLCGLSSLKILRLHVDNSFVLLPANSLSFPSLHTFGVNAGSPAATFSLLQAMRVLPKSIRIDLTMCDFEGVHHGPETVGLILRLIGQSASCELEKFSMMFPGYSEGIPVNVSDMLRPLFRFSNLRALEITVMSQFTLLDDDDLRTMASAWPQLEELKLVDFPVYGHPPPVLPQAYPPPAPPLPSPPPLPLPLIDGWYPHGHRTVETTFHGLILLLRLCPRLRFFHVVIDATQLDGLRSDKPGGGVCNRWVKNVNLTDSPISEPEVVARILLDILPELESVLGSDTSPFTQDLPEGWLRVQEIIRAARETAAAGPVT